MENLLLICLIGLISCTLFIFLSCLSVGTKSILFGVHCWFIHPWFVAVGWWKLYGFPLDPRLWVVFFVHDLGYLGKPNMDGPEGETHPYLGARIMGFLFGGYWREFTLYHSRFLAKAHESHHSRLCCADKMAFVLEPRWFYLLRANLSGEIHDYMMGLGARTPAMERGQWEWLTQCQNYVREWVMEHKDGKQDLWTGTIRDHARPLEETKC